jgi:hypothetical protein
MGVKEAIGQYGASYLSRASVGFSVRDDITIANLDLPLTAAESGAKKVKK